MTKYYSVTVNVPEEHADQVREAIGKVGGGIFGKYGYCSFSCSGMGRSMPTGEAKPFYGEVGKLNAEQEEKIETFCEKERLEEIITAIKESHPYEEPAVTYWEVEIV